MTDEQWHRVGSNRSKLAALLADPVMVEALGVLRDSEAPALETKGTNAADVLMHNGIDHVRRTGFFQAIAALHALTVEPPPKKKEAPKGRALIQTNDFPTQPQPPK